MLEDGEDKKLPKPAGSIYKLVAEYTYPHNAELTQQEAIDVHVKARLLSDFLMSPKPRSFSDIAQTVNVADLTDEESTSLKAILDKAGDTQVDLRNIGFTPDTIANLWRTERYSMLPPEISGEIDSELSEKLKSETSYNPWPEIIGLIESKGGDSVSNIITKVLEEEGYLKWPLSESEWNVRQKEDQVMRKHDLTSMFGASFSQEFLGCNGLETYVFSEEQNQIESITKDLLDLRENIQKRLSPSTFSDN